MDDNWVWSEKYHRMMPAVDEKAKQAILKDNEWRKSQTTNALATNTKHKLPDNITRPQLDAIETSKFDRHWRNRHDKNAKRKGHKPVHIVNCAKDKEMMDL